jgi:hypothetical protein
MDTERALKALETIAGALQSIASPTRLGQPAGDGIVKLLERLVVAAERIAAVASTEPKS